METFLQLVAKDLYGKVGHDLSRTAVVFPNKRASLFFDESLASEADGKPLWSPVYSSISELFQSLSPYAVGDPIRLACLIYKVYREQTGSDETLDEFFFWGELLISDFDDIDKNMADAGRLLGNLQELKDMDDYSFLTTAQEAAVREFFRNFSIEKSTQLKQKFMTIWNHLGGIYTTFRQTLHDAGIAYEGMMYRDVIERIDVSALPYERIVFVGFNVLNKVEQLLFSRLRDAGKALFYWDYDTYYASAHHSAAAGLPFAREAGEFIMRNMREFPNSLPEECFDVMRRQKTVRYVAAPTENAQARYIPQWYSSINTGEPHGQTGDKTGEKENAVVLCNEALLQPVLHSLPREVHSVNITMGFPLSGTPISGLIGVLTSMQTEGYDTQGGTYAYKYVAPVLRHPYIQQLSPVAAATDRELTRDNRFSVPPSELWRDGVLSKVFRPQDGNAAICRWLNGVISDVATLYRDNNDADDSRDMYRQLYRESLFKAYTLVNRLLTLTESGELNVTTQTFVNLLDRLLAAASIPFHGEPAIGLQIMGVLETRNLDFRNLLMLSVNEDKLPKNDGDASFIPYNLRRAFGLTTVEHRMSVYAYYFYRLIQRAENVTLMYNTSDDGLNRGEMSRFMLQYLVESGQHIGRHSLVAGQMPEAARTISVGKTTGMLHRLAERYSPEAADGSYLSPSAINKYLDCHLMFYYRYVAGIRSDDEVSADIDAATFGNVFHKAAELIYTELTARGSVVNAASIDVLLKNTHLIGRYVDEAFRQEFFHVEAGQAVHYNGTQLISRSVIVRFIANMLRADREYAPFTIVALEKNVTETMDTDTSAGHISLRLGGKIDRMDSKDGVLRIVDYKTGGDTPKSPTMDKAFTGKDRDGRLLQTFLYSAMVCHSHKDCKVRPALFMVSKRQGADRPVELKLGTETIDDFRQHDEEYRRRLTEVVREIFDTAVPFSQTDNKDKHCANCDYARLCHIRIYDNNDK